MNSKVKYKIFGKIAILLCLCLVLNNTFMMKSYADESIAAQNPLFIPINTFVTAVLIGSGMIAKNSDKALDAGSQLVNDIISQIKSSEVAKSEADSNYDSPFRVINGGKSEKPNNDNKNGKWFAAAGGALAAHEIYASKDAVKDIMSKAYSLGGYETSFTQTGIVSASNLLTQASSSNVALQLANISNSAVKQFDDFLHCDFWQSVDFTPDNALFAVQVDVSDILQETPLYPMLDIFVTQKSDLIKNVRLVGNPFLYYTYKNTFGSLSYYFVNGSGYDPVLLDENNVQVFCKSYYLNCPSHSSTQSFSYSKRSVRKIPYYIICGSYATFYAFCGYKWTNQNPIQFTNNVYNVNMSFDENFKNWLQGQIQGLGGQLIDAVRLGLTSVSPSWNPNQEQIQAGASPDNVIYQFINNYENPENIPDDETQPDPDPDPEPSPGPTPEPVPDDEYLGSFLLPESITTKFPFCIPFDVARCLRLFSTSDREAPRWEFDIGYGSSKYHVVIDLSMFNDVASFIRPLEYIVFLVGLAISTRSLIRG